MRRMMKRKMRTSIDGVHIDMDMITDNDMLTCERSVCNLLFSGFFCFLFLRLIHTLSTYMQVQLFFGNV